MALTNLISLLAFATSALLISSNPVPANALSIDTHGQHVARHAHHEMAKRRRSTNSGHCKQRPTTSAVVTTSTSTTSSQQSTSTSKAATGAAKTSSSSGGSSGSGSSGSSSSGSGSSGTGSSSGSSGSSDSHGSVMRGVAWGVDNNWASFLASRGGLQWYHHWADPMVPEFGNIEYVPMFWGTANQAQWNNQVANFKNNKPKHILGFNEPDIAGQANMSPGDAANVWMDQIQQYGYQGIALVSPQVAFDLNWLESFYNNIHSRGGWCNYTGLHWYGGFAESDKEQLVSYVQQAKDRFGLNVWVSEIGLTTASGASQNDVLNFVQDIVGRFQNLGFVDRLGWFGGFAQSSPPDGFATGNNAFFYSENNLTPLGNWYSS